MKTLKMLVLAAAVAAPLYAAQQSRTPQPKAAAKAQPITVYRTATCGCCAKWVDHLKSAGFEPTVHIVERTEATPPGKIVPAQLRSCHSAALEGYTVEGHVPADVVQKLLKERPKIAGIAVPGMPAGSPGMESPYPVAYDIVSFDAGGKTAVYARKTPK
jgi:hypothetical protein